MNSFKVFAVGLGVIQGPVVKYGKTFLQHQDNHEAVEDFLKILAIYFDYTGGNVVLNFEDIDIKKLKHDLTSAGHKGAVETIVKLIEPCENKKDAIICIMASNEPPENTAESHLILDLFSKGICNSLNNDHRLPLTKVFAGLATIPLSIAGFPQEIAESHDKFPSWLLFNEPGTNRFAPSAFARQGAHFGSGNTLMMGVAINFGVSIGNDNLIDGHSSIASCAQIGNSNKIGSFVSVEGVLSPMNEKPVVIGNDNFFGTRCRVGTGLVIGDSNFWGSGVDISLGTPLRDLRSESETYLEYVKAGSQNGIQGKDRTMITVNNALRIIDDINVFPGEYLLSTNTDANRERFSRNNDLNVNN